MSQADPLLLKFIRSNDAPCPACNAPLRDIHEDRCPVCREDLVLDVALADPCTRHIALGALALGLGFGFCTSFLAMLLVAMLRENINTAALSRLLPIFVGAPTLGAALILWVRMRRRIRTLPATSRTLAVVACFLLSISFVAWLAINVLTSR